MNEEGEGENAQDEEGEGEETDGKEKADAPTLNDEGEIEGFTDLAVRMNQVQLRKIGLFSLELEKNSICRLEHLELVSG